MALAYPPDRHLLRDLRLQFEHVDNSTSRAWMPVVPELCADDGSVRAGALATLVDVIGGGLAAVAAQPDWIATADLTLHVVGAAPAGSVAAHARVVHAGRTTVVIEVQLHDDAEQEIGLATMSFARLPRRNSNPVIGAAGMSSGGSSGPTTMAFPDSRLTAPLLDMLGIRVVDAARGEVEAPVAEWCLNSLGAMQGGAVATVIDAAAEAAIRAATSEPLVVTDLQITYLALGRVGPIRTRVDVLGANAGHARAHVELVDAGSDSRITALARVVATRSLRGAR
jgi:uncharacterized protein (TIGR00369 family)